MPLSQEVVALLALMALHIGARQMRFLEGLPRSRWLSLAGGISVAYVVVHLLPELAVSQEAVEERGALGYLENHVYLAALAGLALFYTVEMAGRGRGCGGGRSPGISRDWDFWLRITSFALYNAVIGYLVIHREQQTLTQLVSFTVALGLHFVVIDHALRERHHHVYDRIGRWILVAAVAVGWLVGELTEISEAALGILVGFLAGGVILNVFKEELPSERQSSLQAFLIGALAYTLLLLLA